MNIRRTLRECLPPVFTRFGETVLAIAKGNSAVRIPSYDRDEIATRIDAITPGWLKEGNLDLLDYSIQHMPDNGAVIEIGSFAGLSLNHILYMMRKAGRSNRVVSVDGWGWGSESDLIEGSDILVRNYRDRVIDIFKRNLQLFNPDCLPHHIALNSNDFFRMWGEETEAIDCFGRKVRLGGPIAMAYIDGDHSQAQSKLDFENVDRFLVPEGLIVFDDSSYFSGFGAHKTAAEAAARPNYELVNSIHSYCIRKRA